MAMPLISLLTDFGVRDTYAASLKGIILQICPTARIIDITHLVPPQDVAAGAYLLKTVYRDFPHGTIFLAVVDPGVGSSRHALAIKTPDYIFVGPDNGIFSWIVGEEPLFEARRLDNPKYWRSEVSHTFHGRDIFAPVAAHLARGVPIQLLGPPCTPLVLPSAAIQETPEELIGAVIHIDHFGNAITNITRQALERFAGKGRITVHIKNATIHGTVKTYADGSPGALCALIGSSDFLEVALVEGSAVSAYGISKGDPITVRKTTI